MRSPTTLATRLTALTAGALVLGSLLGAAPVEAAVATAGGSPYQPPAACRLPSDGPGLTEGFPVTDVALPARGHLRVAVLFVDFVDAPAAPQTLKAARDTLRPSVDYLETVSRGALQVTTRQSATWVRMPHPAVTYDVGSAPTAEEHLRYITDAVRAADRTFDFSGIDLVWVSSTAAATSIGGGAETNYLDVTADGTHLTHAITGGDNQTLGSRLLWAHETGHALGLPDLYPYGAGVLGDKTGAWDVMGEFLGAAPELFAWDRYRLGWLHNTEVACLAGAAPATLRLTAVELRHGTAMAVLPVGPHRALVVESRRALGFDSATLFPGVLVYLVDTTVPTGAEPIVVQDTTPRSRYARDDATLTQGRTWTDPDTGTTVTVRRSSATGDLVTVVPGAPRT